MADRLHNLIMCILNEVSNAMMSCRSVHVQIIFILYAQACFADKTEHKKTQVHHSVTGSPDTLKPYANIEISKSYAMNGSVLTYYVKNSYTKGFITVDLKIMRLASGSSLMLCNGDSLHSDCKDITYEVVDPRPTENLRTSSNELYIVFKPGKSKFDTSSYSGFYLTCNFVANTSQAESSGRTSHVITENTCDNSYSKPCLENYKRCYKRQDQCDGFEDCKEGSDEERCLGGGFRINYSGLALVVIIGVAIYMARRYKNEILSKLRCCGFYPHNTQSMHSVQPPENSSMLENQRLNGDATQSTTAFNLDRRSSSISAPESDTVQITSTTTVNGNGENGQLPQPPPPYTAELESYPLPNTTAENGGGENGVVTPPPSYSNAIQFPTIDPSHPPPQVPPPAYDTVTPNTPTS